MITFSNCKINLGLHVLNKREDGFHNLETVFYSIPLNDCLELTEVKGRETKQVNFHSFGLTIDGDSNQNLIVKAYHLLAKDFNLKPVNFYLLKNIPMGAGLGGGSSNAAFALKMLNEHFKLNISMQKLKEYAAILGSDCTYFIENTPSFARGRGEVIEPIDLSLKGCFFVLINSEIHVSTAEAFSTVHKRGEQQTSLKDLIKNPIENWKNLIENDFEKSVFKIHPKIKNLKEKLYENGAIYASMSGSGSSVFGLFNGNIDLKKEFEGNFYFSCTL